MARTVTSAIRAAAHATKDELSRENERLGTQASAGMVIGEVALRISRGDPLDTVLTEAVRECARALSLEMVCVMLLDNAGEQLEVKASVGLDPALLRPVPLGAESLDSLAASGPQLFSGKGLSGDIYGNRACCLPLAFRDIALGILCLAPRQERDALDEDDMALINALASQLALAVFMSGPVRDMMEMERGEREIQFAHALKAEILPQQVPVVPGGRLSLRTMRCLDVGGDFHDCLSLPDGRVVLFAGETSGRGARASLNLAHLISAIRRTAVGYADPVAAVQELNRVVLDHGHRGQLVSMSLLEYDPVKKRLRAVRAGSTAILKVMPRYVDEPIVSCGTPLGVLADLDLVVEEIDLDPETGVLVYTDGINKVPAAASRRPPLVGIVESIRAEWTGEEETSLADWVAGRLIEYTGGQVLGDDITLISLQLDS